MNREAVLFALIRSVICGKAVSEEVKAACTPELLEAVYTLATKHDLAHLVGQAVGELGLPKSETLTKCKRAAVAAFGRYNRLEHEYQRVCHTLEDAQIPFIPLKGAVLREYYPEPWMRTSCDVDILVRQEQLDTAAKVLAEKLGCRFTKKTGHDLSFFSPGGTHIELHFDLVEDGRANAAKSVLDGLWEDVSLRDGYGFWYEMSDAFFYFYHIAHMAKHFERGGCGIRAFLDLWILDNKTEVASKKREYLLDKGGLTTFASAARKLSAQWFSMAETEPFTQQFAQFVLIGGAYGTLRNKVTIQYKKRGKWKYVLLRIFLPYDRLKIDYPVLQKYRFLTPLFYMVRWCRVLFKGNVRRATAELKMHVTLSGEEEKWADDLLKYLDLD